MVDYHHSASCPINGWGLFCGIKIVNITRELHELETSYATLEVKNNSLKAESQMLRAPYLRVDRPIIAGLNVTVNGLTTSKGDTVSRIHWDWGDGGSGDSNFPASHTYNKGGTYTISVTAYDRAGLSTTITTIVDIKT